jgi:hypothetical protein
MSIRGWIYNWLMSTPKQRLNRASELIASDDELGGADASTNLRIVKAMNGKVLEIRTYTKSSHGGHNLQTQIYIVPEDVRLTDAITHVLTIKALEK